MLAKYFPLFRIEEDDPWQALWRSGVSEFFATMIFVFIGCGSVVATQATLGASSIQVPSLTLISLAHGFCIMVMVYTVGEISGGHINPAVTWATLITHKISVLRALIYWTAQLLGAMVGAGILKGLIPDQIPTGLGCHSLNPYLSVGQGLGAEIIFTFIFIFVVFATAISPFVGKVAPLAGGSEYGPGKLTPFAVGMAILILHTVGIPLTGASMNPARSFGPAVVQGCWENHWIYWIGPIIGSSVAALIAQVIFLSSPAQLSNMFKRNRENIDVGQTRKTGNPSKDFQPLSKKTMEEHQPVGLDD